MRCIVLGCLFKCFKPFWLERIRFLNSLFPLIITVIAYNDPWHEWFIYFRLLISLWVTMLVYNLPSMQPMFPTLQGGTQLSDSGRLSALLLRGLQTHWWCTAEITERSLWQSGLWSTLWKLFISWPIRTQFKLLLMLLLIGSLYDLKFSIFSF